jgi:hypothetical protein
VLATDDYCVDLVKLSYELVDGTFVTVQMSLDGMFYTSSLSPDLLRDGMTFYVTTSDTVGHTARSETLAIDLVVAPPADDDNDDGGVDAGGSSSPWPYVGIAAVAAASLILFVLYFRRKAGQEPEVRPRAPAPAKVKASAPVRSAPSSRTVPKAPTRSEGPKLMRGLELVEKR